MRPVGLPSVPGLSSFHETNVRTYVHRAGCDPGVWFFSLDAANRLAVLAARTTFHLPYYHARMFLERLPAAYREPLVLCYLEGLSRDEAALRLGLPAGTLKTRLERGRKRLGEALSRRGCVAGAGLLASRARP